MNRHERRKLKSKKGGKYYGLTRPSHNGRMNGVKNDMDKLLGYTDWVWDESEVFDSEHCGLCNQELYPCDLAYQEYADWKIGDFITRT